ncbi:hypothetical protein SNEBB_004551 [Seison nebaliae]|nr:hypothetical protein SNEBB_004551 [Seison nebaliae]
MNTIKRRRTVACKIGKDKKKNVPSKEKVKLSRQNTMNLADAMKDFKNSVQKRKNNERLTKREKTSRAMEILGISQNEDSFQNGTDDSLNISTFSNCSSNSISKTKKCLSRNESLIQNSSSLNVQIKTKKSTQPPPKPTTPKYRLKRRIDDTPEHKKRCASIQRKIKKKQLFAGDGQKKKEKEIRIPETPINNKFPSTSLLTMDEESLMTKCMNPSRNDQMKEKTKNQFYTNTFPSILEGSEEANHPILNKDFLLEKIDENNEDDLEEKADNEIDEDEETSESTGGKKEIFSMNSAFGAYLNEQSKKIGKEVTISPPQTIIKRNSVYAKCLKMTLSNKMKKSYSLKNENKENIRLSKTIKTTKKRFFEEVFRSPTFSLNAEMTPNKSNEYSFDPLSALKSPSNLPRKRPKMKSQCSKKLFQSPQKSQLNAVMATSSVKKNKTNDDQPIVDESLLLIQSPIVQSRNIKKKLFSNIIPKKTTTLNMDNLGNCNESDSNLLTSSPMKSILTTQPISMTPLSMKRKLRPDLFASPARPKTSKEVIEKEENDTIPPTPVVLGRRSRFSTKNIMLQASPQITLTRKTNN